MTEIYIIRHAEAEGNLYRRIQGQTNSHITVNGCRQIEALKKRFENIKIDEVWSSDLIRTMTTAKAIYEPKNLPLHTSPEFREIYLGKWENQPFGQIIRDDKYQMDIFNSNPLEFVGDGAESFVHVGQRVEAQLRKVAEANNVRTVAVFTHGCAMRALIYTLFGKGDGNTAFAPQADNTSVCHIFYDGGSFTADYLCDNSHLNEEISTLAHQSWWKTGDSSTDHNLWFQPIGDNDGWRYVDYRRDAWQLIYGDLRHFDGTDYLLDARRTTEGEPDALVFGMLGSDIAGVLQLNPYRQADSGVGYIPFVYLREKYRNLGIGVQLIGYAVDYYRKKERSRLRLRVAPNNTKAISFYTRYGFKKIGEDSDILGGTYIMEMEI